MGRLKDPYWSGGMRGSGKIMAMIFAAPFIARGHHSD